MTGLPFNEAIALLSEMKLAYTVLPSLKENETLAGAVVADQYPKPGDKISQGSQVALYRE